MAESKVVNYPHKGEPRTTANRDIGSNNGGGERLARLEERVNYLKENSATKTDIVALNGRLDVILEKIGNQPTRADLAVGRRWIIGTIIALVGLALAVVKVFF